MKTSWLILLLSLGAAPAIRAQSTRFWLKPDLVLRQERFQFEDTGEEISRAMPFNVSYGLEAGWKVSSIVELSTGLYARTFANRLNFMPQVIGFGGFSDPDVGLSIPLRGFLNIPLRGRNPVYRRLRNWTVSPFAGIQLTLIDRKGLSRREGTTQIGDYVLTHSSERRILRSHLWQIETGVQVRRQFRRRFSWVGTYGWLWAGQPITRRLIQYQVREGTAPERSFTGAIRSNGNSQNLTFGLRYEW